MGTCTFQVNCQGNLRKMLGVKGATSRMVHLKKIGQVFHFQSVLIFSILNHPCSCLVSYYLFGVFLP